MKKLIISIVATASLALVAKADVLNSASFENYKADQFSVDLDDLGDESGDKYWSGGGTDPEFAWVTRGEGASNALSIDVEEELVREVKADGTARDIGDGLYFDSWVQFTATEDAPEPTPGDKLIVWLKEIPGDTPTYKLCVTAAELDDDFMPKADPMIFETSETIEPNSWHRLSIAANVETAEGRPNLTVFRVYLDSNEIVADKPFYSLVPYNTESDGLNLYNRISSVSFQGKGAIDELVWTTKDPYAPETKPLSVMITDEKEVSWGWTLVYSGLEDAIGLVLNEKNALSVPATVTSVTISCNLENGYNLTKAGFTPGVEGVDSTSWTKEIPLGEVNEFAFEVVKDEVAPANFTVGGKTFETFAEAIAEVAVKAGTIVIAQDAAAESLVLDEKVVIAANTTINFNGKTLTSTADPAIEVTSGTLNLTGNGGITASKVAVAQGTEDVGQTTAVIVGENVKIFSETDNAVLLYGAATLDVSGTLESESETYATLQTSGKCDKTDVKVTINAGAKVIGVNECAIGMNLHVNGKGALTINGGEITGASALYVRSGTVVINGGTFTATKKREDFNPDVDGGKATGDAVIVHNGPGYCSISIEVNGGTFTTSVTGAKALASYAKTGYDVIGGFVTGGQFNTEIDAALLGKSENGKELELVEAETAGYWTVAEKADEKPTAGETELEAGDFADSGKVNSTTEITLPESWGLSEDKTQIVNDKGAVFVKFPEHYSGKFVGDKVMLVLNDTVKPTIGESTEGSNTIKPMEFATDGQKDVVKLNVPDRKDFLFYGVKSATTLSNLKGATPTWAAQKGVNPPAVEKSGDAQFFKVVVTDVLPAQN